MKKISKIVTLAMAGIMCCSLAACGKNDVPEGFTGITYLCSGITNSSMNAFKEMVDTYNSTQGQTDKVYVEFSPSVGEKYGNYSSQLKSTTKYSVATVRDDQIRGLATNSAKNGFVNLDPLLTDEIKQYIGYSNIPDGLINRFRVNSSTDADGKYLVGEGANLLGIPIGSQPHILFYNTKIFKDWKINVVSIGEDKLSAYNTSNGGKLMAHGYAEYKENPLPNAQPALEKSKNERNEDVYKVFNNRIPMSWEEQRLLSRFFQNGNSTYSGYQYGYMSEWWFNYVWSVGGDCIRWNDTKKDYEFSLADNVPNYLATESITVNGTAYVQGDVLHNEDSYYLSQNATELAKVESKVQSLPSTYEAFLEFNKLGIPSNKPEKNEDGTPSAYKGYGIAANNLDNRNRYFLTGTNCPFLVEEYQIGVQSFSQSAIGKNWDIAPTCQYRLYDNNGVYYNGTEEFKNEYLMVIGETYDLDGDGVKDDVYTGEVAKTANGTPIVGETGTASWGYSLSIPSKAPAGTQEAALKFITWVAGPEGQKFIGKSNTMIPANLEYALSDEFNNDSSRVCNAYAAALSTKDGDVGDYSYFTSRTWIDNWSGYLNGDVRRGDKTIQDFISAKLSQANSDLSSMNLRIKGR